MLLEDRILKKWLLPFILSVLISVDSMAQCIPVYKDSSMSVERRVTDLLGRMTLREKIAQLSHLHGYQLYNGQEVDYQKLRDAAGDISYGCIEGFNLTGENVRKAFHAIQKYMVEETRLGIPVFTVTESRSGECFLASGKKLPCLAEVFGLDVFDESIRDGFLGVGDT